MRRHHATGAIAAMLAVLAGGGCSGAPEAAAPMPPSAAPASGDPHGEWDVTAMPDPCRTITRVEVAPIVGVPVEPGTRLESWPPLCNFPLPGPPLNFLYVSDDSRPAAREDYDRQRTDSSAPEVVTGVGDQGYWLPEFQALHVLRGATHLTVKFAGTPPVNDGKRKAIALARIALPRTIAPS